MKTYQIYCDRNDGQGNTLEGCWGSEHAKYDDVRDADHAAEELKAQYPAADFIVVEEE